VSRFDLPSFTGSWTKLPRSLRMRDKRADFVVGSLGGHIVAIGGLGKSLRGCGGAKNRKEYPQQQNPHLQALQGSGLCEFPFSVHKASMFWSSSQGVP
jgi:hypothetical protein